MEQEAVDTSRSRHDNDNADNEILDLRLDCKKDGPSSNSSNHSTRNAPSSMREIKNRRKNINIFKKHKLKYRYLLNRHLKQSSDSGNFGTGSSSMMGSSSAGSNGKRSTQEESTTSPPCTSTSPSSGSGSSNSPQIFGPQAEMGNNQNQPMCMMLGQAVPLVVMMQGQLQSTSNSSDISYSNTMVFKCNMCGMFSNNMQNILNHVNSSHADIHYCFVCNQFHSNKSEYDRHKDVCASARQAFQQIMHGHYSNNRTGNGTRQSGQEQALNLSMVEDVALRAAQMMHNKKTKRKKMKKLLKCSYCKKAFFGSFYLQRHLRSHTGEKACHCDICGKGFVEWRNLRNHMNRFHNGSESASSRERHFKSVSPNGTSDSDQLNRNNITRPSRRDIEARRVENLTSPTNPPPAPPDQQTFAENQSSGFSNQNTVRDIQPPPPSMTSNTDGTLPSTSSQQTLTNEDSSIAWNTHTSSMYSYNPPNAYKAAYASSASSISCTSRSISSASCTSSRSEEHSLPYAGVSFSSIHTSEKLNSTQPSAEEAQPPPPPQRRRTDDTRPNTMYLGSTSSRLELSNGQEGLEQSLNPISTENGMKVFKCCLCGKTFKSKFAMQRHLDFHENKRPYECDQCDYKAKTRPQLKVHVMRHAGEKGFTCDLCGYSCVTHSDLNRHRKSRNHLLRQSMVKKTDAESKASNNAGAYNDPEGDRTSVTQSQQ